MRQNSHISQWLVLWKVRVFKVRAIITVFTESLNRDCYVFHLFEPYLAI